ncbi:hypothetical protein NEIELOOT_03167 [Neisseria elongata subsp. glycolytica ATCC 29315]|uniref:Uncharacterized protein n=1 Tax=Neisseria elongata subsp. glycolytica ATCC 29315 TaxID=546263 RepID=D4DVP5_NEIEG|nr:hypothetical protein NEIELOOT_03167 [Neisseria elongata subsp. glycolytica ATCC 29315]
MAWGDGLRPEDEDKKWGRASSTENNTANEKKKMSGNMPITKSR